MNEIERIDLTPVNICEEDLEFIFDDIELDSKIITSVS